MRAAAILCLGATLLFTSGRDAAAQLTPAPPPPPPPPSGFKAELSAVATSGNSQTQSIGIAGETTMRPTTWIVTLKAGFVRNESDGVVKAKSLRTMERGAKILAQGIEAFGQHAYLRDRFSGVEHRNGFDLGLAFRVLQAARQELVVEGGFGYLNEQRITGRSLSTAQATAGTRYRFRISETSEITEQLLLATDVSEAGTWRLNQEAAITARVTSIVALKLSNLIGFVKEPVPGFEQLDTVSSASLVISF